MSAALGLSQFQQGARGAAPSLSFRLNAAAQALRQTLGAFAPDPSAGRLARLRCKVGAAARAIEGEACGVEQVQTIMVTLTYRGTNADWQPRHITDFLHTVRKWLTRRGVLCRYVWVAELQRRGVIHYHVALWLPKDLRLPKPDEAGWWPHGMTRIETARKAVPYLMKYLTKGNDAAAQSLPYGARAHGRGGLGEQYRAVLRWLSLPAFIQARADVTQRWQRVKGGGWADPDGQHWPSEWARAKVASAWALIRVHDHGRPFEPDGAFSWVR